MTAAACGSSKNNGSANGTTSSTAASSGGVKLAQSGGPGEGPYPWKYPASGTVTVGSGTTISGTSCSSGAPQFDSPYAAPCISKWSGNNGGATYNGVTGTTITLGRRMFPSTANGQQTAAVAASQGLALPQVTDQVRQVFLNYFNKVYDLYGRQVVIQPYQASGNYTAELLNGGQAQACADADKEANQMHAFADSGLVDDSFEGGGTGVFSQCAAQDKMVEFLGGGYFDESWYQQYNPYVWDTVQECERIATMQAEVFGTLVAGQKAVYAGDASLKTQTRKFGTYVPNLPEYLHCTDIFKTDMTGKYHVPQSAISTVFTYGLDISTFQQSAQQAIVQFKAAGVTTIITACDNFSLALLTKAAATQNYHPEWLLIGTAGDDTDTAAQTYDQSEVAGHLFGQSEAAPQNTYFGPNSPAGKLYQKLTGHQIPAGTDGNYGALVWIFDALQAAGPNLTPQTLAEGVHALPKLGAPDYVYGGWSWNTGPTGQPGSGDHTAIIDDRFVYWDANATSPVNGKKGTYVAVFNGQRYSLGNWPSSLPPLFTAAGSTGT
ncbi:MAG TPA: hypothetical protein VFD01_05265 [Candidatus Dormibacteraeota bacterium]|nr:hypothetical protein [Candidatus Dormibacteraeota bacterium]